MKLEVQIRSPDPEIKEKFVGGKIADGITIREENTIYEVLNPPRLSNLCRRNHRSWRRCTAYRKVSLAET